MYLGELIINGEVLYFRADTGEFTHNAEIVDSYDEKLCEKKIREKVKAYESTMIIERYNDKNDIYEIVVAKKIYNEED